jgi:spore coat protein CotH
MTTPATPPRATRRRAVLLGGLGALIAVGTPVAVARWGDRSAGATLPGSGGGASTASAAPAGSGLFTADRLHEVVLGVEDAEFRTTLSTFQQSGEKTWLEVPVTLDGTTYERCGLRLKGNSTLRRTDSTAGAEQYPWLVRLDKVVDGQNHRGLTDMVVRVNSSASSLNEAVALDLLAAAGLASEDHSYARVTVGDASALRVVLEPPGETWVAKTLSGSGILYKAEATGDYTYRGTDPASYEEVFDQESGDDDLTPLIEFLRFVNESSDADFAAGLPDRLDVQSFATYLALEDLMDNYDAIDGPGNNSYLWWDASKDRMTVVGWDHNLTFGVSNRPGAGPGGGGGMPAGGGGGMPAGGGGGMPPGGGGGPGGRAANPLVTRFEAVADFAALEAKATSTLRSALYEGGVATASLEKWSTLLAADAGALLDSATLATEKAAIATYFG